VAAAPNGHSHDAGQTGVSAIGRVVWTLAAFWFVLTAWVASTRALLDVHQVWGYSLLTVITLLFVAAVAGLRIVWRDSRFW
jgi:hypothetical protein